MKKKTERAVEPRLFCAFLVVLGGALLTAVPTLAQSTEADLSITKTNGVDGVADSQLIEYTLAVSNRGPGDVVDARVTDVFSNSPDFLCPRSGEPVCWTCTAAPALTLLDEEIDGQATVNGLAGASAVAPSPDGAHVYATGFTDDRVAVFRRETDRGQAAYGQLSFVEAHGGLSGATAVALSSDGANVYVTAAGSGSLTVFERLADGKLSTVETWIDGVAGAGGLAGGAAVALSPDGLHLYVAGASEDAVAVFARDAADSGRLSFQEVERDGVDDGAGPVAGLRGARALLLSPDGLYVYAAGEADGAVAVFAREAVSGTLDFVESFPAPELAGIRSLAVGGDGAQIYAAAGAGAVVKLDRDAAAGTLGNLTAVTGGLAAASSVAVSPDGRYLFAADEGDGRVATFERDPSTGELTFLEATAAGGLAGASAVAVTADGEHVLAAGRDAGKLAVFTVSAGASCPADGTGDVDELVTLPAGSQVTFTVRGQVSGSPLGTSLDNTATVEAPPGVTDPDAGDNSASDSDPILLSADLGVETTDGRLSAVPGEELTYTVTVIHRGGSNLTGVEVHDRFPSQLGGGQVTWTCSASGGACCTTGETFPGCAAATGTAAADTEFLRRVDLPALDRVTFTFTATVPPEESGTLADTAWAVLPAGYADPDPDAFCPGGAPACATDDDTVLAGEADLRITQTLQDETRPVTANGPVGYRITVENLGPSQVAAASVQDFFAPELLDTEWTCRLVAGSGGCTPGPVPGDLDDLVALDPGAAVEYLVTAWVAASATGRLINTASVTSSVSDPLPGNNSSTQIALLSAEADLEVTKDGPGTAVPGDEVHYEITVSNNEGDDVLGVSFEDLLPEELVDVSWTCSSESPAAGTLEYLETETDPLLLDGPVDMALSPDDLHLYVVATGSDSLRVYKRNTVSGTDFGETELLQSLSDDLFVNPRSIAVAPDGRHVYVAVSPALSLPGAVWVFQRETNPGSPDPGKLTLVERVDSLDALTGAWSVVVSPDGRNVYAVGRTAATVVVFERDTGTGRLLLLEVEENGKDDPDDDAGVVEGLDNPIQVAVSADGTNVYVASQLGKSRSSGALATFSRVATGELEFVAAEMPGSGGLPADFLEIFAGGLAVRGDQVYAVSRGRLFVFDRDPAGGLTLAQVLENGQNGVQGLYSNGFSSLEVSGDGQHLYAGSGSGVVIFRRSRVTGQLFVPMHQSVVWDDSARPGGVDRLRDVASVVVSHDGGSVYAASFTDDGVVAFRREGPPAAFPFLEAERDGVAGVDGLDGARAVTVSPDGEHVYAVGFGDDALVAFERDETTGELSFVEAERDGVAGVDGLDGAAAVAVSPLAGRHVYVAGEAGDAVALFERDASTGELTFRRAYHDGVGGVDGLRGAVALALDPFGENLYVAGQFEAAVAVFTRDGGDGTLSLLEVERNGSGGTRGLAGVSALAVAGDGAHLYAASRVDDALVVFEREAGGGLRFLEVVQGFPGLDGARSVAVAGDGEHVYVAGSLDGTVAVLRRDRDAASARFGRLSFLASYTDGIGGFTGLGGVRSLAVAGDGTFLYAAAEFDNALTILARNAQPASPDFGTLVPVESRVDGADAVDGLDQVYAVALDPQGRNVYAASLGDSAVAVFRRSGTSTCTAAGTGDIADTVDVAFGATLTYTVTGTVKPGATGTLTNSARIVGFAGETDPGNEQSSTAAPLEPRVDLTLTKTDGLDTAVPGEVQTYTLTVGNRGPSHAAAAAVTDVLAPAFFDPASWTCLAVPSGTLSFVEAEVDGVAGVEGLAGASALAATRDGAHVYATGLAADAVTVFRRDPARGALAFAGALREGDVQGTRTVRGLRGASAVAVAADGAAVYVAGQVDDAVAVFARDAATGALTWLEAERDGVDDPSDAGPRVDGLDQPVALAITEGHLYVAGSNDDAVAVFDRGPGGTLSFRASVRDGDVQGGATVDGLDGAAALAVHGDNLYVAGSNDGAVAVFRRAADGTLAYLERQRFSSLAGAGALTLDPLGDHLYVTGGGAHSLVAFRRAADGTLTLGPVIDGAAAAAAGLLWPSSVVVSGDGFHVYVAAQTGDSVVALRRDTDASSPLFGELTFLESRRDGIAGVEGLNGVRALALAPDGRHLYAAGRLDGALAVFARPTDSYCAPAGVGSISETVAIAAGGALVFTVKARVAPGTDGETCPLSASRSCVTNSATVTALSAVELEPSDNASTDVDFLARRADLEITATDGVEAAVPGTEIVYAIEITNHGPGDVTGARVTDLLPPELERGASCDGALHPDAAEPCWICTASAGAGCGRASGQGDVDQPVRLAVGAVVRLTVFAGVRPGALGTLTHTAVVKEPPGVIDPVPGNNRAIDDDTVLTPEADLTVTKTHAAALLAGAEVTYEVTVTNHGPSHAPGTTVVDRLPEAVTGATWTCTEQPVAGLLSPRQVLQDAAGEPGPSADVVEGLAGASSLVLTADGRHAYATGAVADSVVVFRRSGRGGELIASGAVRDGDLQPGAPLPVDGLEGASAAVLSPGDTHLYVAGEAGDAVAVFARDPGSGALTFVQVVRDGVGAVQGLGGVRDLVSGGDGAYLYAAGRLDDALAIFRRDAESGALTFLAAVRQGAGGADGLRGVAALAASADGRHLYAASDLDDAVAVFERRADGTLVFVEALRDGEPGVDGLAGAGDVAVAADGREVYVSAYRDHAVATFRRDAGTGALTFLSAVKDGDDQDGTTVGGLGGASSVAASADGRHLYVTGRDDGAVAVFRRRDGAPVFLEAQDASTGAALLGGARSVVLSPDGEQVYVVAEGDHALTVFARAEGSACTAAGTGDLRDTVALLAGGSASYRIRGRLLAGATGTVTNTAAAWTAPGIPDPDESDNTATDSGELVRRAELGITKTDGRDEATPGTGAAYTITVTNDGPSDVFGLEVADAPPLYPADPAGLLDGSLSWTCQARQALDFQQAWADAGLAGVRALAASPDGRHLYAGAEGADSLVVFSRDPATGALTRVETLYEGAPSGDTVVEGLAGVSGLVVSGDGAHLYVTAETGDSVALFRRDAATGTLTFVEALADGTAQAEGLDGARAAALTADGLHLYVAAEADDAVAVFARDPATGALTWVERRRDGFGDVPAGTLAGARDVTVTGDGRHVYVAAQRADAVAVFERDAATGSLRFVEALRDGEIQGAVRIDGLDFVRALALSPQGEHLYAASLADDAVAVFRRDRESGRLSFVEAHRDGGLDGATALALEADGSRLYAAGANAGAVVVFRRDWATGSLSRVEVHRNGAGAEGLDGVSALTSDGGYLYAAGPQDGVVAIFRRSAPSSCAAAAGSGALAETLDLAAGSRVTFTLAGSIHPAAAGELTNVAWLVPPPGVEDPWPGNDVATDTTALTPETRLAVTTGDGRTAVVAGSATTYTLVVRNGGPSAALGATVRDAFTSQATATSWSCTASAGSFCTSGPGTGPISDTVDLAAGGSLVYLVTATVGPSATGVLRHTATVADATGCFRPEDDPPAGCQDPARDDNVATDADVVVTFDNPDPPDDPTPDPIFADGFESGDLSAWSGPFVKTRSYRTSLRLGPAMPRRLAGYGKSHREAFRVEVERVAGGYRVRGAVRRDDRSELVSPWTVRSEAAPGGDGRLLWLHWWAAPAPGTHGGGLRIWLDEKLITNFTGVDNDTHVLREIEK